ncbi:hypothetical protein [Agaribacter flavus]|uniref:Uncharacterized protein n=1 Tax=Agaribacter flavus TaxID=1902781 RepID=A0ABV7FUC2_9ALTE
MLQTAQTLKALKSFENHGFTNEDIDMGITGSDLLAYHPVPADGFTFEVEAKVDAQANPPHLKLSLSGDWSKEVRLSLEELKFFLSKDDTGADCLVASPDSPVKFRGWQLNQVMIEKEYLDAKKSVAKEGEFRGVVSWKKDGISDIFAKTSWLWKR